MADAYDILVIGGGPGGYVAAIRAAQLGFKTAVVEREHLGGICLNWGCIPTKALLRSAEIFHTLNHAKDYGLTVDGKIGFDPAAVVKRSRAVSAQLNNGVGFLLKKNKVDVIWGEAMITKPGEVLVAASKKPAMQPQILSPRAFWARALISPKISLSRPARGRASSLASSRMENSSGRISRPWCRRSFPNRSSSWGRARSGSNSRLSIAPWARK